MPSQSFATSGTFTVPNGNKPELARRLNGQTAGLAHVFAFGIARYTEGNCPRPWLLPQQTHQQSRQARRSGPQRPEQIIECRNTPHQGCNVTQSREL